MGYCGYSAAKRISEETGGRLIDVGNNGDKLQAAFQQIEDELRTQYVASYTPSNTKLDGAFGTLRWNAEGTEPEGAGPQGLLRSAAGKYGKNPTGSAWEFRLALVYL